MHNLGSAQHQVLTAVVFDSAVGSRITDVDGREYIDFFNNASLPLGHDQGIIAETFRPQLPLNTGKYETVERSRLVEVVGEILPEYSAFQFYSSGTAANEGMLRYATAITGRPNFAGFSGGFHGHTRAMASVSDLDSWHGDRIPGFLSLPYPGAEDGHSVEHLLEELDRTLAPVASELAGFVMEPWHSKAMTAPPSGFMRRFQSEVLGPRGILLLADEYLTSVRCGAWIASSLQGVVPDIVCVGKSMKTGIPFALLAARRDHERHVKLVKGEDSASGQAHLCRNVRLTIEAIREQNLLGRVFELETLFKDRLSWVGDRNKVRRTFAAGALWGVELESRELSQAVALDCARQGILVASIRDCVRLTPALNIPIGEAEQGLAIFEAVLLDVGA
jgi:4-aminobutyrate aminotransferase-like enzyme